MQQVRALVVNRDDFIPAQAQGNGRARVGVDDGQGRGVQVNRPVDDQLGAGTRYPGIIAVQVGFNKMVIGIT